MNGTRTSPRTSLSFVRKALCLSIALAFLSQSLYAVELRAQLSARFVRGDSSADGVFDVSDALLSLNYLFLGGDEPPCMDAADMDDDGGLTIADAVQFFSWRFLGGAPPVAPFPACGVDPTRDLLGCAEYEVCTSEREESACETWLDSVAETAASFGFRNLSSGEKGVYNGADRTDLEITATCDGAGIFLVVESPDGEVAVFERKTAIAEEEFEAEIRGEFPGVGTLRRVYQIAEGHVGAQSLAAEYAGQMVVAEENADGTEFRARGDYAAANVHYKAVLETSSAWAMLHRILFRMSGMEDVLRQGLRPVEADHVIESLYDMAIPAGQNAAQDSDQTNTNRACTGGAVACVAGLLGVITAGACVLGGVACLAAGACQLADCSGDG